MYNPMCYFSLFAFLWKNSLNIYLPRNTLIQDIGSSSLIISLIEGGNQQIVKYFMEKSGVQFVGGRTTLTFVILYLEVIGVLLYLGLV